MNLHLAMAICGGLFILGGAGLWYAWIGEALDRSNSDAVRDLRRSYVEKRLGLTDRRDPRRGSPPPLVERRSGKDRRRS